MVYSPAKVTGMPTTSEGWPSWVTRWNTVARRERTDSRIAGDSSPNESLGTEVARVSR